MTFKTFPIVEAGTLHVNDDRETLFAKALSQGEGHRAANGALAVTTGAHTGRAAKDKFIVKNTLTEDSIWWDNCAALSPAQFNLLRDDFLLHAEKRELFVQDLYGGADPKARVHCRVITEFA